MNYYIEAEPLYYTEQIIDNVIYEDKYGEYQFIAEEE